MFSPFFGIKFPDNLETGTFRLQNRRKIIFLKKALCHGIKSHLVNMCAKYEFQWMSVNGYIFRTGLTPFRAQNPECGAAILNFEFFFS